MEAYVGAIGVCGPGLDGWANSAPKFTGAVAYQDGALPTLRTTLLPPTERRRSGRTVQLAVQVAQEAVEQAGVAPSDLRTVFACADGDLDTVHELCLALAQPEKVISPTRFHNSVHNAPAGYWSIATGARSPSTSIACSDWTFAAGLLEALCQLDQGGRVLLVAYDWPAPEPLHAKRPLAAAFGTALLLTGERPSRPLAKLTLAMDDSEAASVMANPELERLRNGVPAARALPVLAAVAGGHPSAVTFDYLGDQHMRLWVEPWA